MKIGGQILWNATPICKTSLTYLMGRRLMKDVLGNHIKGPIVPFGSLVEYHPFNCEGSVANPSIWKESLTSVVPRTRFVRGWETMDASEIYSKKRLNAKYVLFPKEKGEFMFPIADGRIKTLGGDQDLRISTLIRQRPIRVESHLDFLGQSEGSLPPPPFRMPVKQLMISGPCQETSCTAITSNAESNFTRREKNHSLFHWNTLTSPELQERIWMLCKKAASMTIGISMDQEISLIRGQVSLTLLYWKRNLQTYLCGPGRTWQKGKRHPGQIIYGQNYGRNWEEMLSWRRSRNGQWKNQSSRMLEDYEEFISLTLRTRSLRKPSGMLERNWKHQWHPLCLARHARKTRMERPVARLMVSSQNLRVSWKPVNPHDCVWKNLYRIIMRTLSQEELTVHFNITIWYTNLFLCLTQWRYPQQKQQWIKNGRNWRRFWRGTHKSQKQIRGDRWSKDEGRKSSFCLINGHLSFEKWWIGGKAPKIQRSSCTTRRNCRRWFWILCSIHWTRIFSISSDSS